MIKNKQIKHDIFVKEKVKIVTHMRMQESDESPAKKPNKLQRELKEKLRRQNKENP